jgi:hypothetical protein
MVAPPPANNSTLKLEVTGFFLKYRYISTRLHGVIILNATVVMLTIFLIQAFFFWSFVFE